jgi:hypothetical protein
VEDDVIEAMQKTVGILLVAALLIGAPSLQAQSSNKVWFVTWNGQPTPSSDVSAQAISSGGSGSAITSGAAGSFVSQTNFLPLNSPYDVAVDPAMGKAYVLDNNVQGETPEYIYSFNLAGTPAQIAASAQIIYTMPVPQADVTIPLVSGITLDPINHWLYFNQIDPTTGTNSYVGRLDLASSSCSDIHSSTSGNPTVHQYYVGQVPGQGPIALDATNIYIGAINGSAGNSGIFAAPRSGGGTFSEIVTISTNDTSFTNGFVGGIASDPQDHLIYYVTFTAGGYTSYNFNTNQNALWVYDTVGHASKIIHGGYPGYPDNMAIDPANGRYYFTLGRDGTGNVSPANYQAIYTGTLGSTNTPTLFYTPQLSGQDTNASAGSVALQGIFIEDSPTLGSVSSSATYSAKGAPVILASSLTAGDPSSTLLAGATVAITGGNFTGDGDTLAAVTNGTGITASYNGPSETLTLSGSDTIADYQQVLRTVAFSSTNSDPTRGGIYPTRTIAWTVNDGSLSSALATNTLALLPVNAPTANRVAITTVTNGWHLIFAGIPSQYYVIQFAASASGPWTDLSSVLTASSVGLVEYTDPTFSLPKTRFYRVRTGP